MSDWRRIARLAIVVFAILAAVIATTGVHNSTAAPLGGVRPGPWCGGTLWHLMTLSDRDRKILYAVSEASAWVALLGAACAFLGHGLGWW